MPLPRLFLALAAAGLLVLAPSAHAADAPRQMTFQGRLVRADGSPETAPQSLRFALYPTATGGAPLWEESHPSVPVTNGYYAVILGAALPLPASVVDGQALYLGVSLVGQSELTPRLPVVSVPYALLANDSSRLEGRAAASFANASHGHAAATTTAAGFMSAADKAKLNSLPPTYGTSLNFSSSTNTLSVTLAPSGGTNGTATTVARSNHTHALTCTYRTATGNTDSGASSTAWCSVGEALTGGGCSDLGGSAPGAGITFSPTGITPVDSPTPTGAPGYVCRAPNTTSIPTAFAICCRNSP